ncbi:MAG TPA: hypothetical protein PLI47_02955 [Bacteroidia bacterium]|nr:hypothetical protein [Bacteroidota bacterium]MBP9789622.1 hypothetical protein [Bacteroidia bacterium]MBK7571819.1 hypothetical protein [Bacteroidota bacterium]MBK8586556.1 hypothetical protein [Bacteroidota bacterium]MBP9923492.1 hypothetical protein [Bacteroidia bacterium]
MDVLNSIVSGMSKEQVRFFKLFMGRSHYHEDRMDEKLFDYMRKSGDEYDEEKIVKSLYQKADKNAFYRLRNRLLADLNKSLMLQHVDDDQNLYLLHLLSLAKYFLAKNNTKTTLYFLKKAEAQALKTENVELLDIIYGDYIRLSHDLVTIDPEKYIQLRIDNHEHIRKLRTIDDILAVVSYKMKVTQNFSSDENPVLELLEQTVKQYSSDSDLLKSPTLRFRIYHSVSQILLQKRDYFSLEEYLLRTFKDFTSDRLFNKANHDVKLQMLVYIVNTLFKNSKVKESLAYANKLKESMEEFNRSFYDKYLFFYYNSLVINYSKSDRTRAIEILNEMRTIEKIVSVPFYEMFIYLNLAVSYFDTKDFHQSIRSLNKLHTLKGYTTADQSLQFKIAIAELMIRYELRDFDVLENKIRLIKKDYSEFFTRKSNEREIMMIEAISKLIRTDSLRKDKAFLTQIKEHILSPGNKEAADADILNYRIWLEEKI